MSLSVVPKSEISDPIIIIYVEYNESASAFTLNLIIDCTYY